MKPANDSPSAGSDDAAAPASADTRRGTTPNADMQAEDAGTADSGAAQEDDSATAAARAMKQTSKTAAESGNPR